jgi:hypothetical protein
MSIIHSAQLLTHSTAAKSRESAEIDGQIADYVPVRAGGGFVKLSDRLLANLLSKNEKSIPRKRKIALKKGDAWRKYVAAKKLSEERSNNLSICIEADLSRLISQFHIGPVPRLRLSSGDTLPTSGKYGRQAKGLCMFDTSVIEERWGPHFHKFPELPPELRVKIVSENRPQTPLSI